MATGTLEERVSAVEQELAEIKQQLVSRSEAASPPWWDRGCTSQRGASPPPDCSALEAGRVMRRCSSSRTPTVSSPSSARMTGRSALRNMVVALVFLTVMTASILTLVAVMTRTLG